MTNAITREIRIFSSPGGKNWIVEAGDGPKAICYAGHFPGAILLAKGLAADLGWALKMVPAPKD